MIVDLLGLDTQDSLSFSLSQNHTLLLKIKHCMIQFDFGSNIEEKTSLFTEVAIINYNIAETSLWLSNRSSKAFIVWRVLDDSIKTTSYSNS